MIHRYIIRESTDIEAQLQEVVVEMEYFLHAALYACEAQRDKAHHAVALITRDRDALLEQLNDFKGQVFPSKSFVGFDYTRGEREDVKLFVSTPLLLTLLLTTIVLGM